MQKFGFLALIALAYGAMETVTDETTTDVTITSCADDVECPEKTSAASSSLAAVPTTAAEEDVTVTVDETTSYYTTVCDSSSAKMYANSSAPIEASSVESSEDITYVDVTTTPTITASTGVEATETSQSTLMSTYSSSEPSSSLAGVESSYEGGANNKQMAAGAIGAAGLAAMLL